ncbi:spore coat protein U domain-containing protein [Psychrobacter sp. B38]|uniref:spore coat protein U domain-containing protein n=1 Tax=Psychrobacter sp. B38 TaxID=3143538 RepID=UPI00320D665B
MQFNKTLISAALLTVGGFTAISANAADSSEFSVTTTITSVCDISASAASISFTDIAAGSTGDEIGSQQSAGDISVMCSNDAPYVVNLSSAGNADSTTGEGIMTGTLGDKITYQLSSNTEGKAWGNTGTLGTDAEGTGVAGIGVGVSTPILHPVYAKITSSTDVKQDTYTDTITASIVY